MGLGMIIFGFFCLHFHFLNTQVYNVQLFPLSISLPIIILGIFYAYHHLRKKEYLYFIIPCILLIIVTFIPGARFQYLILLTITYLLFMLFMYHQVSDYHHHKAIKIWLVIYTVSGFLKASTSMGGFLFDYQLNQISSLLYVIAVVGLSRHLWKMRKHLTVEKRPKQTPPHLPISVQIITIIICITIIIFTHTPFVQYSYDQSIQLDIYQFVNDKVKVQYFIEYGMSLMKANDSGITPYIELLGEERPHDFSILLNKSMMTKGYFEYNDDQYQYVEEERNSYESYFEIIPECTIYMDGKAYQAKVEKVNPDLYGYHDDHIQISQCIIQNGHLLVLPRIEFYNQKNIIHKISIDNANGESLNTMEIDEMGTYYNDGVTFYPECPISSNQKQIIGPYHLTITYTTQDNQTLKKEYPLTIYENHMP